MPGRRNEALPCSFMMLGPGPTLAGGPPAEKQQCTRVQVCPAPALLSPPSCGSHAYVGTSCSLLQGLKRQRMKPFPKGGWDGQLFLLSSRQVPPFPSLAAPRAGPCLFQNSRAFIYSTNPYSAFMSNTSCKHCANRRLFKSLYFVTPLYG